MIATGETPRLALGTAQFGMAYGATNPVGRVMPDEVSGILADACAAGIDVLDTARAYGLSETVLGDVLDGGDDFAIVTKILPFAGSDPAGHARASVEASLQALRCDRLAGILVHRASDLAGAQGEELWAALTDLKTQGVTNMIGVSAYGPDEARTLVDQYRPDIIQLPCNLFDQRAVHDGLFDYCRQSGVEVHVRSVFLQGVLLTAPAALPARLGSFRTALENLHRALAETDHTPVEAALGFIVCQTGAKRAIVGVTSREELAQIVAALSAPAPANAGRFALDDPQLLNPSLWPAVPDGNDPGTPVH